MFKGLLAGGITMGVAAVFPPNLIFPFYAAVLGVASGVYPGLAMARPDLSHPRWEWTVASLLTALGVAGLWLSPLVLTGAWVLHAAWSVLHSGTALGEEMPETYPGFSAAYAMASAAFVAYMWAAGQ